MNCVRQQMQKVLSESVSLWVCAKVNHVSKCQCNFNAA